MKVAFISLFVLLFFQSFAQNDSAGDDFKLMKDYSGKDVTDYAAIPIYNSNNNIDGSPFFSTDWLPGSVTTKDNKTFSNQLLFMYDKNNNELYYKRKDSLVMIEINPAQILSFTLLKTDQQHLFMPASLFSKDYNGQFFEILVFDNKYSLLKLTQTTLRKPSSDDVDRFANKIPNAKYVDKISYFLISNNNNLQPVQIKKKDFIKALDVNTASKAEAYIKNNNGNFNEYYVINMLNNINKQVQ